MDETYAPFAHANFIDKLTDCYGIYPFFIKNSQITVN